MTSTVLYLFLLLALCFIGAHAQDECDERAYVKVTGVGRGVFKTTVSLISLSVDVTDASESTVQSMLRRRSSSLVTYLHKNAVNKLVTGKIAIRRKKLQPRALLSRHSDARTFSGIVGFMFQARRNCTGMILKGALENGATRILGIRVTGSEKDIAIARHDAIKEAVNNARAQGYAAALAAGTKIIGTNTININKMLIPRSLPAVRCRGTIEPAVEVVAVEQKATALVTVVYASEYFPKNKTEAAFKKENEELVENDLADEEVEDEKKNDADE